MLCFRKILVAEKFMEKKGSGENRSFHTKNFCLKVPKLFVGEPFSLSLVSGFEIIYASKGYVTIFRRKFCVSASTHFVEEHFCAVFQKISDSEKVFG